MKTPVEFIHDKCNVKIHCSYDTNKTDQDNKTNQNAACMISKNQNNVVSSNSHNNANNKESHYE